MINHIWTVHVTYLDNPHRQLRIVAPDDIDQALACAKEKMARKFPNQPALMERWPGPIHPDYRIAGVMRGEELDDDTADI